MRKELNDYSGTSRIEIATDGKVIEVGHDIDDNRCLSFLAEESQETIDRIRAADTVQSFRFELPEPVRNKYVLWRESMGTFLFYDDEGIVLKIHDHEASVLYTAAQMAREERAKEYDYEDYAENYLEELLGHKLWDVEQTSADDVNGSYSYTAIDDDCIWIDRDFIQSIEADEYSRWSGGCIEEGDCRYRFKIDGKSLLEDDD